MFEAIEAFKTAADTRGVLVPGNPTIEKLSRCGVEGKERGKDGAYILYLGKFPAGGFQNFRDGQGWQNWRLRFGKTARRLTTAERAELKQRFAVIRREREAENSRAWLKAATKALEIWNAAFPASNSHPYAVRKDITVDGLREWRGLLLIPVYGHDGLRGLQFIPPEQSAKKKFLTGTRMKGSFYLIGDVSPESPVIIVCEGAATGKTLHSETNHPVYVAFTASNLASVAQYVRKQHPQARIVIAADNDWQTPENPGLTKAREAALLVGGSLAVPPPFSDCTDFNDLHRIVKHGGGYE